MATGEASTGPDRTRNYFEAFKDLNDQNAERRFAEAMGNSDGTISTEDVAAYLHIIETGNEKKLSELQKKIEELSGNLDGKVNELYAIHEKLDDLLNGQASAVAELLELVNSLEKTADSTK